MPQDVHDMRPMSAIPPHSRRCACIASRAATAAPMKSDFARPRLARCGPSGMGTARTQRIGPPWPGGRSIRWSAT